MKRKLILTPLLVLALVVALVTTATGCAGGPGPEGDQGPIGLQGEPGEQGEPGSRGIQGAQGSQGEQGEPGLKGSTGAKGATGSTGPAGEQGEQGEQGPAGPRGAGSKGATGATGPQGIPGPRYFITVLSDSGSATATKLVGTTAQLQTTGTVGTGDEARIRIIVSPIVPMTLGQLMSISWWENLTSGYPPHVDVILDLDGNPETAEDTLAFEYAYNLMSHYNLEAPMPYGALTGAWYQVFSDDGNGPKVIDDLSFAWLTSQAPGPPGGLFGAGGFYGDTLANWKLGHTVPTGIVDCNSRILGIEIEVDNWVVQTDALVDCITINGALVWVP